MYVIEYIYIFIYIFFLGIPVFESAPTLSPLYDLIVKSQLNEEEGVSPPASARSMRFYAVSTVLDQPAV